MCLLEHIKTNKVCTRDGDGRWKRESESKNKQLIFVILSNNYFFSILLKYIRKDNSSIPVIDDCWWWSIDDRWYRSWYIFMEIYLCPKYTRICDIACRSRSFELVIHYPPIWPTTIPESYGFWSDRFCYRNVFNAKLNTNHVFGGPRTRQVKIRSTKKLDKLFCCRSL